jgi:NADPH:quinone reductase-like Zn-dependent oxidoreductase
MMALRAHARGGPEQLVYEPAPVPEPGPGEVLVAVHAAGITFAEFSWDESWTTSDGVDRTPVILAQEVSGVVAGIGAEVGGLAEGDAVLGLIDFDRDGGAAEFVATPAANLTAKPASLPHLEASTLPLAGMTAWQALVDHAQLKPGALSGLAERTRAGSLRPLISQVLPLAEGRQAYESGQHSRPPGKTLLMVR